MKNTFKVLILIFVSVVLYSCSSGDDSTVAQQDNFDREAMLVNWADNIIIPSYTNFKTATDNLNAEVTSFTDSPSISGLQSLRAVWLNTYLEFQKVSMFEIAKAEEINFRNRLNVYPTNASEIEQLIVDGNYDFSLPSTLDAQGFPAIDYLLHGLGTTDEEILSFYTTNANANNYKEYLTNLSATIDSLSAIVLDDWVANYRTTFVANTGSSANGSVDKLVNDYLFYYEKALRAGKVGIPAGVFSGEPLPGNVEAFYRQDISKQLLLEALTATQNFFNGKYANSSTKGESLKSYLDFLNTIKNGEDLSALINNQFNTARNTINGLNTNFVSQIQSNNGEFLSAYDELQRNVVLLKVDMLQALSIDVDFVDADGD